VKVPIAVNCTVSPAVGMLALFGVMEIVDKVADELQLMSTAAMVSSTTRDTTERQIIRRLLTA